MKLTWKKVLNSVKISKSPGPDSIHPKVLQETQSELLRPLTTLFKKSLNEGKLPKDWKKRKHYRLIQIRKQI